MTGAGDWAGATRALGVLADEGTLSGTVLVRRGEDTVLEVSGGFAHRGTGTRVHPGTRFGLASLSKPFTAAALLSCARDGLLDVQDRVAEVLPTARRPSTLADEVTVHHLLTHTSGMGDYAEEDPDLPGYVEDYGSLWRDLPTYRMERPDDYLPLYDRAGPVAQPGVEFHYCNGGYVLLGAVLEQVTGVRFAEAVDERVLRPAGMTGAGYLRMDEAHVDVAEAYLPRRAPGAPWRSNIHTVPVVGSGDGGAFATAADLDRFLRAVASGDLLGEELTAAMLARHVDVDDDDAMGYGLFVGDGWFGHGGGDPGIETGARFFAATDTSIVVLCNQEGGLDRAWDLVEEALGAAG